MDRYIVFDAQLTKADRIVLEDLAADIRCPAAQDATGIELPSNAVKPLRKEPHTRDGDALACLNALNDPKQKEFMPTVFSSVDYTDIKWDTTLNQLVLKPYVRIAKSIVRVETDVVMLTHLLLYFTTSVPSALYLFFWNFSWFHGILHFVMQASYAGAYTLMMHQHIHGRGVLKKQFPLSLFDQVFPYILDPLMGHTWNSYFYHHVKHHHVEGNGPNDLSSTLRYQRDDIFHFLHYVGRFFFLVWFDLPIYFIRNQRNSTAAKMLFWELGNYAALTTAFKLNPKPTFCVLLLPLLLLRLGLMVGNWGQHAFVDEKDPNSDYRSSITLIDVPSNRHSFNDGYHTSHHLNPMRHWREHPNAFMKSKELYASQGALVFHNIDYIFITIRLMMKDYETLAKCMVPIGKEQVAMSLEQRMDMLKRHTRRFTDEEIRAKFNLNS